MHLNANQAFYLIVDNKSMASLSKSIAEVYRENHDDDGFLYVTYASHEMFGNDSIAQDTAEDASVETRACGRCRCKHPKDSNNKMGRKSCVTRRTQSSLKSRFSKKSAGAPSTLLASSIAGAGKDSGVAACAIS